MKKVLKSYMISFVKSWVETVGTILFILMLSAVVLGMLTSPLQISSKVSSVKSSSNTPDYYAYAYSQKLTNDFVYDYFIKHEEKSYHNLINYDFLDDDNDSYVKEWRELTDKQRTDYGITGAVSEKNFEDPNVNAYIKEIKTEINKMIIMKKAPKSDNTIFTDKFVKKVFSNDNDNNNFFLINLYNEIFKNSAERNNFCADWDLYYTYITGVGNDASHFDIRTVKTQTYGLSNIVLDQGRLPNQSSNYDNKTLEAAVSSAYFKENKLKIGDILKDKLSGFNIKVTGVGASYETIINGEGYNVLNASSAKNYAYLYLNHNDINKIYTDSLTDTGLSTSIKSISVSYYIKHIGGSNDISSLFTSPSLSQKGMGILESDGRSWIEQKDYSSISNLKNIQIQLIIYLVLGCIVLLLAFVFINFIIKKELNESRVQIGIFKAMGYTRAQLSWIFAIKTLITIFVSVLLGYIISFPVQLFGARQFSTSVAIYFAHIYISAWFIFALLFGIPTLFMLISYALTLNDLKESSLELIQNAARKNKPNYFLIGLSIIFFPFGIIKIINHYKNRLYSRYSKRFSWRMRYAFTNNGIGKFVMVISLISFSSFMFMALLSAGNVMNTLIKQGFNTINENANYSVSWRKHNSLEINVNDDGTPQLGLNKKYMLNDWKPSDINYLDYAKKGYTETAKENLDTVNDADKISQLFSDAISHFDEGKPAQMVDKVNLNVVKTLLAMLTVPYTDYKGVEDFKVIDDLNISSIEKIITMIQKENNFLNNKNNKAFYAKDFGKLSCELSSIFSGGKNSSCNSQSSWQIIAQNGMRDVSDDGGSQGSGGLLYQSLVAIIYMLDKNENYNPLIAKNTYIYNSIKDTLYYSLVGTKKEDQNIDNPTFRLVNANDDDVYGAFTNGYNLSADAKNKFIHLADNQSSVEGNSADNPINAIVSYRMARGLNVNVGDVTNVNLGTKIKMPIYLKVIAIDQNDTFMTSVTVDNKSFINAFLTQDDKDAIGNNQLFNSVISQEESLAGKIDLKNIADSIKTLKVKSHTFSIAMLENKSLGATLISDLLKTMSLKNVPADISKIINALLTDDVDGSAELMNNVSLSAASSMADTSGVGKFNPFKITQSIVMEISSVATTMMTVFILLDTVLLLIILVVIMNIIVDEAKRIILTMRSIGYKNWKVNWMVMGNYITWNVFGFIISYLGIILLWSIVSNIVWSKFTILVSIPFNFSIPAISFAVVGLILISGWFASMYRINKQPLTMITD